MHRYDDPAIINVGVGEDLRISELAVLIAEIVGFKGRIDYDSAQPDGTPRKLLDVSRLHDLGWAAKILLREGIAETYRWFQENISG